MTVNELHALPDSAFIRERELLRLVPISRSTVWRLIKAGDFPSPTRISARANAWQVSAIRRWLASRATLAAVRDRGRDGAVPVGRGLSLR